MSKKEYQAYSLFKNEIEDDEPFDLDNPWYKDDSITIPATSDTPAPKKEESAPAKEPTAPESQTPSPELQKLQAQLTKIKNMVSNLDQQFQNGEIEQEAYLKKKDFLAQKMGTLMGQIEQLKE
jgi:hypothetical protein